MAQLFFLEFKKRITETYTELFGESEGSGHLSKTQGFAQKWGWYQSIYGLANGDIRKLDEVVKLKLHQCLQHLSFEKDKYELEAHMIKSNSKK